MLGRPGNRKRKDMLPPFLTKVQDFIEIWVVECLTLEDALVIVRRFRVNRELRSVWCLQEIWGTGWRKVNMLIASVSRERVRGSSIRTRILRNRTCDTLPPGMGYAGRNRRNGANSNFQEYRRAGLEVEAMRGRRKQGTLGHRRLLFV